LSKECNSEQKRYVKELPVWKDGTNVNQRIVHRKVKIQIISISKEEETSRFIIRRKIMAK
jgi:hypothetical protein